jgi:tetratricopeptide (TPR) repeat protein
MSRRTFDRWMKGELSERGPRPDSARVLEHLFGMSTAVLFGPPPDRISPAVLQQPTSASAPVLTGGGWGSPGEILVQAQELTISNTDPALLSLAAESIESIVQRYEDQGPQQLVGEARLLRRMVRTLLLGRQSVGQRQQLFGLAARSSGLLAYMAVNAGRADMAEAYCVEAEAFADQVGDVGAKMWILGTRALNLYYVGDYAASDAAAAQGIALSPHGPQAIRLWVNGRARALARQGDARGTVRAIGRALDLSDQQQRLPGGVTSCISFEAYSPARTLANAVTAHLSTGDIAKVLEYAGQIEDLVEQSPSQWTRTLVSLDVATALLRQGRPDLEQALSLGTRALHISGSAPIHSVWQRATELLQHTGKWQAELVVRDYASELAALNYQPVGQAEPDARP